MSVRQVFGRVDVTNESGGSADGETLNRHPNRQERIAERLRFGVGPSSRLGGTGGGTEGTIPRFQNI